MHLVVDMERVVNMVNGRIVDEELGRISQFFENLTDGEFQEMLERCGNGIIEESCQSSYVLVMRNSFRMEKSWKDNDKFYQNTEEYYCDFQSEEYLLGAA